MAQQVIRLAILFMILFCVVKSEWELLAEQNVDLGGYFDTRVGSYNIGSEGDALFSKIAYITNPSLYKQSDDDKYIFRLMFTQNGEEIVIEWRQSSWLLDSVPTGVEIISAPTETVSDSDTYAFRGLGKSSNPNCYIDGNGNIGDSWWNCVCSLDRWNGGIPAYNGGIATRMRLYIDSPIVESEYELLAEQDTINGGYFGSDVKIQNVGNEGDGLFSKIAGITTPSIYQDADGKYTFKLIYNQKNTNVEFIIEWKQTSWLLDNVIDYAEGVEIITAPPEGTSDSSKKFRGLAKTNNENCFIDGNGNGDSSWWNCVCSLDRWDGGIPAYDGSIATRMRLYIEIPVIIQPEYLCLTTTIDGYQHLNGQYIRNIAGERNYGFLGFYVSDKPNNCADTKYRIWKWDYEYNWGITRSIAEFDYGECGIDPAIASDCNGEWVIGGIVRSKDEFQVTEGECSYGRICSTCSDPLLV